MGLSALGLAWLLWRFDRRRDLVLFLAPLAVFGLIAGLLSWVVLGSLLPPHLVQFHADWAPAPILANYPTGLLGSLASPARGLLLYVPLLGWAAWMALAQRDLLASRTLATTALGVVVVHWQVLVLSRVWSDGQAFGARLFSDVLVWFFLLAAMASATLGVGGMGRVRRRMALGVGSLCLAFSLFVNVRGATAVATWRWDWLDRPPTWALRGEETGLLPPRVWNWRYPQFLAGLLPREADADELRRRRERERGDDT